MKQNFFNSDVEIEEIGTSFKTKKAKITEKNIPYIFSILANFYSKPKASVVREITSNCFDAHIMVNKPDEVAIVRLFIDESGQHFIEFVDKGPGMSEETMDEIFMNYGESTKRDSDDFIGCFGLGSKSPFSVSDYFYVITKHDGLESTYLLNSTQMIEPTYDCLIRTELSDKNDCGTIIRVPIKQNEIKDWENAIIKELRYFKNVFVVNFENVVNDYKIKKFENYQIREDLFIENPHRELHLTLGDVTYPIRFSEIGYTNSFLFNAALTFKIGELSITPNREELKYDDKTIKVIKDKFEKFKKELYSQIYSDENINIDSFEEFVELQTYKESNRKVKIKNIIKDGIYFNISDLKLQDFEYKINLCGNYYKLPFRINYYNRKNIRHFGYEVLYIKNNQNVFTKYNSNSSTHRDFASQGNQKLCIVENKDVKIKKSEKLFLKDNEYKAIICFNKEAYFNKICKLILKNNTLDLSSKIKFHHLSSELINKLNQFIEQIYSIKTIEELNIPINYGKVKKEKEKVKKSDESIIIYSHIYGSFTRNEIFESEIVKSQTIKVYGVKENIEKLKLISKTFSVEIFYTSKNNLKHFENVENYFYVEDIFDKKINYLFFNNEQIINKLKSIYFSNKFIDNNYGDEQLFDFCYISEFGVNDKSKIGTSFYEIINFFINFQEKNSNFILNHLNNEIKDCINDKIFKHINRYCSKKIKIYNNLFEIQKKFFNLFYCEIATLINYEFKKLQIDQRNSVLENNLKLKIKQLNKLTKTINKLKNEL